MNNKKSILIKNTYIVDGTGNKGFFGNLLIENGRINKISKGEIFPSTSDFLIVDGEGLITAPGFIDVHSHNDLVPFMAESLQGLKLMQGVTTELVGQCGLGAAPCSESVNPGWQSYIKGVVGSSSIDVCSEFLSFSDYLDALSSVKLRNNYAALISHGALRTSVMGFDGRFATEDEVSKMGLLLEKAMESGAYGLSFGLQYMPGIFSGKAELHELCKIVAKFDGIVMVHLRNHDISISSALSEMIEIAKAAGVKLHISHLRSYGSETLGCRGEALLKLIDLGRKEGVILTFDEHLYLSGSTLLTQLLPPWFSDGGNEEMLKRLESGALLKKLKAELEDPSIHYDGWDNYSYVTGFENILITSVNSIEGQKYIGKTIGELATSASMEAFDFFIKLLQEEGTGVGIVTLNVFSEEDLITLLQHPYQMIGSDSIPAGRPHPRLYGNFPLFIGKFVREKKSLSIEEGVRKATSLPAKTLGIRDRGILAEGMIADIVLFDLKTITGYEDYMNPTLPPKGIKYVLINGSIAVANGQVLSESFGQVQRLEKR